MDNIGWNWICALALLFTAAKTNGQLGVDSGCRTGKFEIGTCQSIRNCPPLVKIVRQQPISKSDQEYLQNSVCFWEGKTPIVCCPKEPSTTPPPPPPPTTQQPATNSNDDLTSHRSLFLLPDRTCGQSFVQRVWGGNETQLGEYPWLALIGYKRSANGQNTFLCGGAIINSRYILTAAHCTTNIAPYTLSTVRLGEHDQSSEIDCDKSPEAEQVPCAPPTQNFNIERVITHPAYNSTTKHNDIALLRLDREADTSTGYVTPICIPHHQSISGKNYNDEELTVAGWGKVNSTTLFSNVKMAVNVPVRDNSQCGSRYRTAGRIIIKEQLCAGGVAGKDSCTGDSGGPLMAIDSAAPDNKIKYFATGIVSYGPRDCGTQGWPGVYTRVGSYAKWILDNIEE